MKCADLWEEPGNYCFITTVSKCEVPSSFNAFVSFPGCYVPPVGVFKLLTRYWAAKKANSVIRRDLLLGRKAGLYGLGNLHEVGIMNMSSERDNSHRPFRAGQKACVGLPTIIAWSTTLDLRQLLGCEPSFICVAFELAYTAGESAEYKVLWKAPKKPIAQFRSGRQRLASACNLHHTLQHNIAKLRGNHLWVVWR